MNSFTWSSLNDIHIQYIESPKVNLSPNSLFTFHHMISKSKTNHMKIGGKRPTNGKIQFQINWFCVTKQGTVLTYQFIKQ